MFRSSLSRRIPDGCTLKVTAALFMNIERAATHVAPDTSATGILMPGSSKSQQLPNSSFCGSFQRRQRTMGLISMRSHILTNDTSFRPFFPSLRKKEKHLNKQVCVNIAKTSMWMSIFGGNISCLLIL